MEDENLRGIRDKFFECELPATTNQHSQNHSRRKKEDNIITPQNLIQRIDKRLQKVVEKACKNSFPACKVVETFESFLVRSFMNDDDDSDQKEEEEEDNRAIIEDVLLKPPIVTRSSSSRQITTTIQMFFDGESPTGGFHRLLVHAVAQFHGLKSTSNLINRTRILTITGETVIGKEYKLLDHILDRRRTAATTTTTEDQNLPQSDTAKKQDCSGNGSDRDIPSSIAEERAIEGWELVESVKVLAL